MAATTNTERHPKAAGRTALIQFAYAISDPFLPAALRRQWEAAARTVWGDELHRGFAVWLALIAETLPDDDVWHQAEPGWAKVDDATDEREAWTNAVAPRLPRHAAAIISVALHAARRHEFAPPSTASRVVKDWPSWRAAAVNLLARVQLYEIEPPRSVAVRTAFDAAALTWNLPEAYRTPLVELIALAKQGHTRRPTT